MKIDPETLKRLRDLLDESADWGQRIEQYAADYGQLKPNQVQLLPEVKLRGLWSAQGFANVRYEFPRINANQLQGLRTMTALLADRSKSLGDRFCLAREECRKIFTRTQPPVILRTLLILEGGRFGTIATKVWTDLLLKQAGKPELDFGEADSITVALENVKALMEKWAPSVGATKLGERARIPWHLCKIIKQLEESTLIADIEEIKSNKATDPTTVQALVNARVGQGKYGLQVRKIWNNRCCVTGSRTRAALEASHIKRWADSNDIERLDPNNGLLLTANLHKLFDAGLISFEDSGKMLVSSMLSQAEQNIFGVVGKRLSKKPSGQIAKYLSYHRARFLE
jgi:hypothetical protein